MLKDLVLVPSLGLWVKYVQLVSVVNQVQVYLGSQDHVRLLLLPDQQVIHQAKLAQLY